MSESDIFQMWLEKVCQRPLPKNPMARIRTLAKELAEGALEGLWETDIHRILLSQERPFRGVDSGTMSRYLLERWNNEYPEFGLLRDNEFLSDSYRITKSAFDLIEEVEPTPIFISYKRSESSAFALLILARLKEHDLEPFLDMAISPGDDWHAHLEERIENSDYFILLLGKETLMSAVTLKEIGWALKYGAVIIPIWHNGFEYKSGEWDVSDEIDELLKNTHTIRVVEESASAYNTALVELLNRFGITP